jgi:hypothetical protein
MDSLEIHDLFLSYMKTLPIPDQKEIRCGSDFLEKLTPDAEEDLKNEIWNRIKYNADYITIILSLQEYHRHVLPDSDDEEEVITDNELDEGNGLYA